MIYQYRFFDLMQPVRYFDLSYYSLEIKHTPSE
jgi:hypothetical protein